MTLAEFSRVVGTSPKWVLNALANVGARGRYSIDLAQQLTVARVLHAEASIPLATAMTLALKLLRAPLSAPHPVVLRLSADGDVSLTVDVHRVLSSFNARMAELRTSYAPRVRGRPRTRPVNGVQSALDWGLDLSLIHDNLEKTPVQRLRQLDAMGRFSRGVRRAGSSGRST